MMIEALDAVIADRAVGAARGPVEHAGVAVLNFHNYAVHNHIFERRESRRSPALAGGAPLRRQTWRGHALVVGIERSAVARNDSRISPRSEEEESDNLRTAIQNRSKLLILVAF